MSVNEKTVMFLITPIRSFFLRNWQEGDGYIEGETLEDTGYNRIGEKVRCYTRSMVWSCEYEPDRAMEVYAWINQQMNQRQAVTDEMRQKQAAAMEATRELAERQKREMEKGDDWKADED